MAALHAADKSTKGRNGQYELPCNDHMADVGVPPRNKRTRGSNGALTAAEPRFKAKPFCCLEDNCSLINQQLTEDGQQSQDIERHLLLQLVTVECVQPDSKTKPSRGKVKIVANCTAKKGFQTKP